MAVSGDTVDLPSAQRQRGPLQPLLGHSAQPSPPLGVEGARFAGGLPFLRHLLLQGPPHASCVAPLRATRPAHPTPARPARIGCGGCGGCGGLLFPFPRGLPLAHALHRARHTRPRISTHFRSSSASGGAPRCSGRLRGSARSSGGCTRLRGFSTSSSITAPPSWRSSAWASCRKRPHRQSDTAPHTALDCTSHVDTAALAMGRRCEWRLPASCGPSYATGASICILFLPALHLHAVNA